MIEPMTRIDEGTAYDLEPGFHDPVLTEVGRGTPMGALMRRHWQPIGLTSYASDLPRAVRVLGEDVILWRDRQGRPGLVHPRCTHRGSSLLYGRIDDCGIRCCYHGWAFDVEGRCTQQPCEPHNGLHRDKFRQPWYPVEERYGLIWAYLGPPDRKPLLPRYNLLDEVADGEQLLHRRQQHRFLRGVPNPFGGEGRTDSLGFVLPVDDTSFRIFTVLRSKDRTFFERIESLRSRTEGTSLEQAQRRPGDWEAQGSQGRITLHSEEHLASSDRGVRMLRRLLRDQIDVVDAGGIPMNVGYEPGEEMVNLVSGQYLS